MEHCSSIHKDTNEVKRFRIIILNHEYKYLESNLKISKICNKKLIHIVNHGKTFQSERLDLEIP